MVPIDSVTFWGGERGLFVSDYEMEGFATIGRSVLASHRLCECNGKTRGYCLLCSSVKKK